MPRRKDARYLKVIIDGKQNEPAAQGKSALERLENGEATINDLRKEAELSPVKGGEWLLKKERFDSSQ